MDVGAWIGAAVGLTLWLLLVTAAVCALLGMLLAPAARLSRWAGGLAGALGGALAVAVLGIMALARMPSPANLGSGTAVRVRAVRGFGRRRFEMTLLVVAAVTLGAALFLDAVSLSAAGILVFALPVLGSGLDALIVFSLVVVAGVALLVWSGFSRWAAAATALLTGCWLALLGAIVAVWLPLRAAVATATTAGGTIGDAAAAMGIGVEGAEFVIPSGGLFDLVGLAGRRFTLAGVELSTVIPHLSVGLGIGTVCLIGAAFACGTLAVMAAHRG